MSFKHNLPLMLFTILMPGVVFGYYFYFNQGFWMNLIFLGIGIAAMGLASLHLGKPAGAAEGMRNLKSSWFSREAFFFLLFLAGLCLHLLTRLPAWAIEGVFYAGLLGVLSSARLYRATGRMKFWPVTLDFLIEGFFVGWLLPFNEHIFAYHSFALIYFIKLPKDLIVSGLLIVLEKRRLAVLTAIIALSGLVALKFGILGYVLWLINTFILRAIFFARIERPEVSETAKFSRASYLPQEYKKYFPEK